MSPTRRSLRATNEQLGLVGALLLLGALVAGLVWHAQSRMRSHRATAEESLRHQAAVAAWQYERYSSESLLHSVHAWTAPLTPFMRRSQTGEPRQRRTMLLPRKGPTGCVVCGKSPVRAIYSFRLDIDAGSLSVVDSSAPVPPEPTRTLLAARLAAAVRADTAHQHEPHGLFVDTVGGALRAIGYAVVWSPTGPRELFGMEIDPRHLARPLADPLRDALIPPAVLGSLPVDSVLHVSVHTRAGIPIYQTGPAPAGALAALDTLAPRFGGLVATVTVRPERASVLLPGGLPRSNWPLLGAVLALAGLLTVLALMQLKRMRELARLRSRFVASVSHELRTPLAQISMFSETLLLDRARSDEERVDFLTAIYREARRLTNLVESVLRFSRGDGAPSAARLFPRELQDVSAEIGDTLRGFAPLAAASDVELLSDVPSGVAAAVEPGAIRQLLLNLLDNAIKYGPAGQTITIRLESAPGAIRLAVEDEGPGVPSAARDRVFEPFARLEEGQGPGSRVAGTGIGLSVVRDIAVGHGGRAWIEDAPGGGARIVVELPARGIERDATLDARSTRSSSFVPIRPASP
jgi:signal transduction histidine kinase